MLICSLEMGWVLCFYVFWYLYFLNCVIVMCIYSPTSHRRGTQYINNYWINYILGHTCYKNICLVDFLIIQLTFEYIFSKKELNYHGYPANELFINGEVKTYTKKN